MTQIHADKNKKELETFAKMVEKIGFFICGNLCNLRIKKWGHSLGKVFLLPTKIVGRLFVLIPLFF